MRWVVAAAGTALMAVLGAVYSWSLYVQPLAAAFGWSARITTGAFSTAIFFLGVGAIAGGRLQDRHGPRPVALAGAALWALGNVAAGLGVGRLGAPWLYLSYGVVGGLGLGLGYVTPVAAVAKWFGARRGLGTGLVVMGFGLGAFLYNLAMRALGPMVDAEAIGARFTGSGLVFGAVGLSAAALLRDPPPAPPGGGPGPAAAGWPPSAALRTPQFWALWAMLFLNVSAGILFISSAVPLLCELTAIPADQAVAVYGFIAVANGLGRFLWGAVSDRLGRRLAFALIYGLQAAVFAVVGGVHALPAVTALFALVLLCYGGGFGTMPSLCADWFGTRHLGVNYGWLLSAWGVAGVAGPGYVAAVKDLTGSYLGALPVMAAVLGVAVALPALARPPRIPARMEASWRGTS
jgi:OFA family oxalate/formate antiporter-like MFS transporter